MKKADPLTLMTMCFKEVGAVSSARAILDSLVVGINKVGTLKYLLKLFIECMVMVLCNVSGGWGKVLHNHAMKHKLPDVNAL